MASLEWPWRRNHLNIICILSFNLSFLSRILGLSPFHIYPNTKCHNGSVCTYSHIILVTILIILLLHDLYKSILFLDTLSEGLLNLSVRVLWTNYMLVSNLTRILTSLYTVTRNRNHMTNVLCLLSRVDNKLFRNKSKQSAYSQHRSYIIMQLWVTFISYVNCFCMHYVYCPANSRYCHKCCHDISVCEYCTKYEAEVPLIVRSRFCNWVRHFEVSVRRNITSHNNKRMFSPTKDNLTSNRDSHSMCTIQDLQILYSELYDVLYSNNNSYEVLILLSAIAILANTVHTTYQ